MRLLICFARWHAKQAHELAGPGGSRGAGSNHGAADRAGGASPVKPLGQPASSPPAAPARLPPVGNSPDTAFLAHPTRI